MSDPIWMTVREKKNLSLSFQGPEKTRAPGIKIEMFHSSMVMHGLSSLFEAARRHLPPSSMWHVFAKIRQHPDFRTLLKNQPLSRERHP